MREYVILDGKRWAVETVAQCEAAQLEMARLGVFTSPVYLNVAGGDDYTESERLGRSLTITLPAAPADTIEFVTTGPESDLTLRIWGCDGDTGEWYQMPSALVRVAVPPGFVAIRVGII